MPTVSVIVVSYNTRELTRECLASIYHETRDTDFELIVVDNNSTDGSQAIITDEFPDAWHMFLDENVGFAGANNLGAEAATGEYILLLNPDTVVLDGAVDTLVRYARENPRNRVYGGSTWFADGTRNPTAGWMKPTWWSLLCSALGLSSLFRGSPVFDSESLKRRKWDQPFEVDIITGCFLLMDRELWDELGGFDPRFHMYGEDADLSLRAGIAGATPVLVPEARIIHHGGASERVKADKMVRLFRAKTQLFRKHWSSFGARYAVAMLKLYPLVRSIALSSKSENNWKVVWRRRTEWAHSG